MSSKWNLTEIRKMAGLPLVESVDDDDDEDPDAKIASEDKRQKEFEAKRKAARAAEKKAEAAKPVEKKPEPANQPVSQAAGEKKDTEPKAEDKSDAEPVVAKRRGKAPQENSKSGSMRTWLSNNPSATRGQFIAKAADVGMTKHHANAYFYILKKKNAPVKEAWIISHPSAPSYVLAENRELNQLQWIDVNSFLEPMVFFTESDAKRTAKYMSEWKGQGAVVEKLQHDEM